MSSTPEQEQQHAGISRQKSRNVAIGRFNICKIEQFRPLRTGLLGTLSLPVRALSQSAPPSLTWDGDMLTSPAPHLPPRVQHCYLPAQNRHLPRTYCATCATYPTCAPTCATYPYLPPTSPMPSNLTIIMLGPRTLLEGGILSALIQCS